MGIWNMIKVHKTLNNLAVFTRCTSCSRKRRSWHFPRCVTCVKTTARSASLLGNSRCRCGRGISFCSPWIVMTFGLLPEPSAKRTPLTSASSKMERAIWICRASWCQAVACSEPRLRLGAKTPCAIKQLSIQLYAGERWRRPGTGQHQPHTYTWNGKKHF